MQYAKKTILHRQIQRDIECRIFSGEWPPGHPVPFEADLAQAYGCSRMTVNKALSRLASAGLIERRRRLGSWVAHPPARRMILEYREIESEVLALGQRYGYELLSRHYRNARPSAAPPDEIASSSPLLELLCLHTADTLPFCLEERLINLAEVPQANSETFTAEPPGPWLQRLMPWISTRHVIRASSATGRARNLLRLSDGAPCLVIEQRTLSLAGVDIAHARRIYPGEKHFINTRCAPPDGATLGWEPYASIPVPKD